MPVTVIAGPDHSREPRSPVPFSGRPSSTSASRRNSSSRETLAVPRLAEQALDGHVAVRVVERRERVEQDDHRVGRGAPVLAAVLGAGEGGDLHRRHRHPPQPDREGRHAGADAPHVADQHRIGAERLRVRRGVGVEGAADLLLPLDHDLDPDRRPSLPGPERTDVRQDVRLGVGRAASEDRVVAPRRLERGRVPELLVAGRDDVVVRVQEHRRRTGRGGDLADDDRGRVRKLEGADLLDARVAQQLLDEAARLEQSAVRLLRVVGRGDGRDRDELGELTLELGHQLRNARRGLRRTAVIVGLQREVLSRRGL